MTIGVVRNARLSNNVAVHITHDEKVMVEYKGRELGEIDGNTVLLDENDCQASWIDTDLARVGMEKQHAS